MSDVTPDLNAKGPVEYSSLWTDAWYRLLNNRLATIGFIYVLIVAAIAVLTPWIAPFSYFETNLELGAVAPNATHWFGTDEYGRDLFTRVLYGSRVSLAIGLISTLISVIMGVIYGALSGYVGGRVDGLMMRIVDVLYVLPFAILVILIMVFLGRSVYKLFIALGIVQWLVMARIVRGQVVSLKNMAFVEAARALGIGHFSIIFRHVIPNTLGPVIVFATLTVPAVILEEAFLSFIGLGVPPPMASWGTLINDGVSAMTANLPWMILFPCLTLMMTLLALNFLGDGLRDALDPKS